MKLKPQEFPGRLKAGQVPEAILLFGQDQGLIMKNAQDTRHALFDEAHADFDLETFYGADLNLERFISSCQAYPLLAPRRFVILKEADRLQTPAAKSLIEYLKRPSASTLLLVLAGNLDTRNLLRKHFESLKQKTVWAVAFYPLSGYQLRAWLQSQLQQDGFRVDHDAMQHLLEYLAGDTRNTQQELNKLKLFMGNDPHIRMDDVLEMVGETTTHSGFGLSIAITSGNLPESLAILDRLLQRGDVPIMLLGIISDRLRRLVLGGERLAGGEDPDAVSRGLKVFWKEKEQFLHQSRTLSPRQLAEGLLECQETDKRLKGGSDLPVEQIMERFVMRLARRFRGHRPPASAWR